MNKQTKLWVAARIVALAGGLVLMPLPAAAGADDYRLIYGQGSSSAFGALQSEIVPLDPAFNTGHVFGGGALSTNGFMGVEAFSDASQADLRFSLFADVGNLRNTINSGSKAGFAAPYPGAIRANAGGVSIARWGDSFTLSGAFGTPVRLQARIELDATGSISPFPVTSSISNSLSYSVTMPVVGKKTFTCVDRNGSCSLSQTFEFEVFSGTKSGMNADLTLSVYSAAIAAPYEDPLPTGSDVSFTSRGRVFLDVLTPGYTYTMSSGLLLISPIPEPPMAASMLAGLLLVGQLARRRLKR